MEIVTTSPPEHSVLRMPWSITPIIVTAEGAAGIPVDMPVYPTNPMAKQDDMVLVYIIEHGAAGPRGSRRTNIKRMPGLKGEVVVDVKAAKRYIAGTYETGSHGEPLLELPGIHTVIIGAVEKKRHDIGITGYGISKIRRGIIRPSDY
jgi:hypothetical protein